MSEFEIIRRYFSRPPKRTVLGVGDDCALLRPDAGLDLAVTEFLTQRLVGLIRLTKANWHIRSTELSYIIAPWARGEGYASEAALATAQWLFGDQKFERVELRTAADNTASQQVAQKIGCISEGVLRGACIAHVRAEDGEDDAAGTHHTSGRGARRAADHGARAEDAQFRRRREPLSWPDVREAGHLGEPRVRGAAATFCF